VRWIALRRALGRGVPLSVEVRVALGRSGYLDPTLTNWLASRFPDLAATIEKEWAALPDLLDDPIVRVVFGGHFSSGKSSVINMLIRRPLLPTGDLPETGVPCELASGRQDEAAVVAGMSRRSIPLDTATIADRVSLIGRDGDVRPEVAQADRIVISIHRAGIPAGARWIDSPGINDVSALGSETISQRARDIAAEADVLVWVLNSNQAMSTVEHTFLRAYAEEHHPQRVVYLINAFLTADTRQGWRYFQTKIAPSARGRIAALNLAEDWRPRIVCASARAAAASPRQYGRPETLSMINEFGRLRHPRVRIARLQRALARIRPLVSMVEQCLARVDQRLQSDLEAVRAQHHLLAEQRRWFEQTLASAVAVAFTDHLAAAEACGGQVAAGISEGSLYRDDTYSRWLHTEMTAVASNLAQALRTAADRCAAEHNQMPLDDQAMAALHQLLAVPWVPIPVPCHPVAAGARAVDAVHTFFHRVGNAIGTSVGSATGPNAREALARDAAGARSNAIEAGRASSAALMARRPEAVALLLTRCTPRQRPAPLPDTGDVDGLRGAHEQLTAAAAAVEAMVTRTAAARSLAKDS
jgi:hypothetical protein